MYGNIIWNCAPQANLNKLISLQKTAIRVVMGAKYNSHTEPLFKKSMILPFNLLNWYFCLDFMQQKHQEFLPQAFKNHFPTNREVRIHADRELRDDYDYFIPFARTNHLQKFPLWKLPSKWNELSEVDIKGTVSRDF